MKKKEIIKAIQEKINYSIEKEREYYFLLQELKEKQLKSKKDLSACISRTKRDCIEMSAVRWAMIDLKYLIEEK